MKMLIAAFAACFVTAAHAETVNFDGCEGFKVEGANYYNFVDPRCKTNSAIYESTGAEDTKAARKAAEEEAAREAVEAAG